MSKGSEPRRLRFGWASPPGALLLILLPLPLLLAAFLLASGPALGHAAIVQASEVGAVRVEGFYDTGEPMAGAQVAIFAPDDPAQPWLRGQTDAEGVFLFVPDGREGRWSAQMRQAGHGGIAYLELTAGGAVPTMAQTTMAQTTLAQIQAGAQGSAGLTLLQKGVMAASLVWGCIGTALCFRRRRVA